MRTFLLTIGLTYTMIIAGCTSHKPSQPGESLRGTWISDRRETEWGPATIEMQFGDDGHLRVSTFFKPGGPPVTSEGEYSVRDGEIISRELYKGVPLKYWLKGDVLTVRTDSETLLLRRHK